MKTIVLNNRKDEIIKIASFEPFIHMSVNDDIVIEGETYTIQEKIFDYDDDLLIIYTTN